MIFHFLSGKIDFFVKRVQIIWCKMAPLKFSHKIHHILWIMSQYYEFSSFLATFAHLNDFMLILRKLYYTLFTNEYISRSISYNSTKTLKFVHLEIFSCATLETFLRMLYGYLLVPCQIS